VRKTTFIFFRHAFGEKPSLWPVRIWVNRHRHG
jgi:hypothetical protein